MTTGFGFCPQCGTPRIAADQRFCAACGNDLSALVAAPPAPAAAAPAPPVAAAPTAPVVAPPAAPVSPTQAAPQPAAAVPSQPPTPPAWAAAPAQSYPAGYPAPGAPGVPAAPAAPAAPIATIAGIQITPKLAVIGAIALAVVIGAAYLFMNMNSKPGSISVTPASFSCSAQYQVASTIKLPSSLKATDSDRVGARRSYPSPPRRCPTNSKSRAMVPGSSPTRPVPARAAPVREEAPSPWGPTPCRSATPPARFWPRVPTR